MLTNQRAIAHWIEEDSHTTERNSVLFSQVHSLLCCLTVLIGLVNRFNPLRATEKELSSFPLHLVQYKRRTVHQNTLIATSLRCNPLSSFFFSFSFFQSPIFFLVPLLLVFSVLRFVTQLPLQAADIGKALQFLRKVIFIQNRISTVLHHFQRHGPKDRGKLIDAFRSGKRESSVIKNRNNQAGYQLPHQHNL